ncbi:kelch-like protein 8 [Physella acuta]|uniref:kelch-like protein 8 n=1 Tax=Physella acuta TaxID=109671 RepID=UPI0027DAF784|nr:kelch-like protein 8 [Physella acuta]
MGKQDVRAQIFKGLENVWDENILFDYAVKVQDETIQCHRLILAACSEFFKALFRSGMKEVTENLCVLNDVSCEIFRMILNTLYSGEIVLTLGNLFEVWRCANMLQIRFLVDLCESFAIENTTVDTWVNMYTNAKRFNIKRVLDHLHIFMLKNFEHIRNSTIFLQMSFNEVRDLIKSQDLVVYKEDLVLKSVIKWAEYSPDTNSDYNESIEGLNEIVCKSVNQNQNKHPKLDADNTCSTTTLHPCVTERSTRIEKLAELLKLVRISLVSPAVLFHVYNLDILSGNNDSKNIISNALTYNLQDFKHGQWPSSAIQRSCSRYINAGVNTSNGRFEVQCASDEKLYKMLKCTLLQHNIQLVCFEGELYATGTEENLPFEPCRMFVFSDNNWNKVIDLPSDNLLLAAHGDFIYILNIDDKSVNTINPKRENPNLELLTDFPENVDVKHAMFLENYLILFSAESCNGVKQTSVHKLDVVSKVWTRLDNLEGPAEQLISFRNDKHSYILQADGRLWLVVNLPSSIEFKFLVQLWHFECELCGGLTYEKQLILFGQHPVDDPPDEIRLKKVPGHFDRVTYWGGDGVHSNFIPITLPISCLTEIIQKKL